MGFAKRKGVYYVQFNVRQENDKLYLDRYGKRKRWKAVPDKREARTQESIIKTKLLQGWEIARKLVPVTTLSEYVEKWRSGAKRELAAKTYAGYKQVLDLYILPPLGGRDIKSLTWADVKALLSQKQRDGYITIRAARRKQPQSPIVPIRFG